MQEQQEKSALKRWGSFLIGIAGIWFLSAVALPAIVQQSEAFRTMAAFIDFSEIDTGQFYYTDVEVCSDAELGVRHTFEYMPRMDIKAGETKL